MKRNNSPCVDVCKFSGKNGWCLGCGRTRVECKKWKSMKPYAKILLFKDLKIRLSQINSERKI